ncbi:MAG: hypothetical protein M0025_01425 [Elusimicrobia bacterium]|nr:hypothetical protein [Elusimicrobiota bacterium]
MKKILIILNSVSGIIALALLLYVSLYGPVAVIPFERMIQTCLESHPSVPKVIEVQLAEAHIEYYRFIAIPLCGLFLILLSVLFNIGLLTKYKERISAEK